MPKPVAHNPVQSAVQQWLQTPALSDSTSVHDELLKTAPKRFTIYEPMVLFPSGSFSSDLWKSVLQTCEADAKPSLWRFLLAELSKVAKSPLTNLAINQGIPLHKDDQKEENILRSPNGLQMLYGDFGSADTNTQQPTTEEFDDAFWVTTKQNGLHQTWAPRWTMFSRGNVKEKARVLQFPKAKKTDNKTWAVDLYGGIGYFVFSYVALGMKVVCWELNPWSVEGMRRGAMANKWTIKVVKGNDLELSVGDVMTEEVDIVVFQEDNNKAVARIQSMQALDIAKNIKHVNCGFLPTSEPTWHATWQMTKHSPESHLHLHENVGVHDIASRQQAIEDMYTNWSRLEDESRSPRTTHVEQVKTFAPGVWHCVFDISIIRT